MKIEEEIFYGYILDEEKLTSFGFDYVDNKYIKEYKIHNNEFTALIEIDKDHVFGKVIDNNFDEEFPLFRNEKVVGEFIGSLREEYKEILLKIRKACFKKSIIP